ncbi:methyl-accepting chemotaxis protein [Bacillus sp. FJAT-50079]|uniref:methyl-accepting chemotaxis protein n=1 Tax=Bacillus sp. FJAT-50079 TaxID=2833577 RepID=UPI001BCA0721|nr:methyl-accepting chemotaxis protein [Bacillus sp. FJAT-50079]MBS4206868.1 methyl-accepting chemotaxis protein [Bacillus sp. FJAT-50079]
MKSLKGKILTGFLVVLALVLAMVIIIYTAIYIMNKQTTNVIDEELPLLLVANEIEMNITERTSLARAYLLYGHKNYEQSFVSLSEANDVSIKILLKLLPSKETNEAVDRIIEWEEMIETEVFELFANGDEELAWFNLRNKIEPVGEELISTFKILSTTRANNIKSDGRGVIESGIMTARISIGIGLTTIVIGLIVAIFMANSLSKPIVAVANYMRVIASGDLTQKEMKTHSTDEVGVLYSSVNYMKQKIRDMVMEMGRVSKIVTNQSVDLSRAALEVSVGSEQVAKTMEELSIFSETQVTSASELQETMSSLSEFVHDANEHGIIASEESGVVLDLTQKGSLSIHESISKMELINVQVREAVGKVNKLEKHSKEIDQLVNVISDIAGQTNLLALNASIEAARVGEQGKGFAVVANEVRKLAEQVESSVNLITSIVSMVQTETEAAVESLHLCFDQVESGTKQINSTGHAFDDISKSIQSVVKGIHVISEDLSRITNGTHVMNSAIFQIASISEEASAGIEETAASSEQTTSSMQEITANSVSLSAASTNLDQLIRQFKI